MLGWLTLVAFVVVAAAGIGLAGFDGVSGTTAILLFGAAMVLFVLGLIAIAFRNGEPH